MKRVYDYETGERLEGEASPALIAASLREYWAGYTIGAAYAYEDDRGVWQYVAPDRVAAMSRSDTTRPRRVYVE